MTTQELVNYYANLLILQYVGKPKAYAEMQALASLALILQTTTQEITFSGVPTSGVFSLSYGIFNTIPINWNDSTGVIQSKLQALPGLSQVTVSGSLASKSITVTFTNVPPPATLLGVAANTLGLSITVTETDVTLPLAILNAYNLVGDSPAVGVQLDVLGKYVGVVRSGYDNNGNPITLDDNDFRTLIQIATFTNNAGSSLATIQQLIATFFPGEILVFDYQNMQMSYMVSSSIGSQNLIQLVIAEGLLPKPMGVSLSSVIYAPDITRFFGFRTYALPAVNSTPFGTYTTPVLGGWISYADAIS